MFWSFFRRVLQAAAILALFVSPFSQINLSILLTLLHLVILVQLRPFAEKGEHRVEVGNETALLLTQYFLMLFLQDFLVDDQMVEHLGQVTIGVAVLNFLINAIPILGQFKDACCRYCKKKMHLRAQDKARQTVLKNLRSRTSE